MAEKYIKIRGQLVAVTEEVYYAYYHMGRQSRTQAEKDSRRRIASYDALDTDELLGIDLLVDRDSPTVEDLAVTNVMVEKLHQCLPRLSKEDQEILFALFFDGKSEREYAKSLGITQVAVHKRCHKALAHLKKLLKI